VKEPDKLRAIEDHINQLVGCSVTPAPHWTRLAWLARDATEQIYSPEHFLAVCNTPQGPVCAVRMMSDGSVHEVLCTAEDIKFKFQQQLTQPFKCALSGEGPHSFQTVRKKGASKEHDLTVFYYPFKNGLPFNQLASNTFKMQIYGDVLLVQQTKEPCFLPRERYVSFFHTTYQEQFASKPRRKEAPAATTLTPADFEEAKALMTSEFQQLESIASSSAEVPSELAKAAVMPPASGKELAELLRAQGHGMAPASLSGAVEVAA
jgi:hypothetical protein